MISRDQYPINSDGIRLQELPGATRGLASLITRVLLVRYGLVSTRCRTGYGADGQVASDCQLASGEKVGGIVARSKQKHVAVCRAPRGKFGPADRKPIRAMRFVRRIDEDERSGPARGEPRVDAVPALLPVTDPFTPDVYPLRLPMSPRAITCAWISAAPSKMLRMRASHSTRLISYSSE